MLVKRYLQRNIRALNAFVKFNHGTSSSSEGRYQSFLSEEQATKRHSHFEKNSLNYHLGLNLKEGSNYEGRVDISFILSHISKDIFLDYAGSKIHEITINNQRIDSKNDYEYLRNNRFVNLPTDALKKGENQVSIKFENAYSNDGNGLHSFIDTDKKQYLYSNCEPYAANKMFPCFDQPDLKGVFNLTAAAPSKWRVISNEHIKTGLNTHILRDFKYDAKDTTVWSFNPTPLLSTYLYTVIAGPYLEFKCQNTYNNISMSVFSRESLFEHLKKQAPEIFEVTIESMKFFEKFFGYPYPFSKYDQIFCPEYNMGAMENPGAVTFNDKYIFKEEVTRRAKSNLANTISHELSHMWFGDLVTMKWWNDLWLNESFAEFISHYCLANVTLKTCQLEDFWYQFFQRKGWAYREDQLRTTHPIATQVLNTEQAENIFDGITYAKGAATIKQLLCLISPENFSKAMKNYFWTYQWSNATLNDFIKHLQECYHPNNPAFPKNLEVWKQSWLMTSGLNECIPRWQVGTYDINVEQGYALEQHQTLRFHKMKVAFFDKNAKLIKVEDCLLKDTATTELTFKSENTKPAAVLLNYDDEAYIKIRLDKESIKFFKKNLSAVEGELTRALIWRALFDMVRDGKLTSQEFVDIIVQNLPSEVEDSILMTVLQYTQGAIANFTPKKIRNLLNYKCFDTLQNMLKNTDASNKNRVILLRSDLIKFCDSDIHRKNIYDWFNGNYSALKDFELGLNDRWNIVKIAFRDQTLTNDVKEKFFETASKLDPTDTKVYVRKFCDALLLTESERAAAWERFFDKNTKDSNHLIAEYMSGFNDESRLDELTKYHDKYWDSLIEVFEHRSREYSRAFFRGLFPSGENVDVYLKKISEIRSKIPENQITLRKMLDESEDDLKRKKTTYDNFFETLRSL